MRPVENSTMKSELRIAIAGGGLLGRLCSWQLARQGHQITLFEAKGFEHPVGACWTAAGMISPLSELVSAELAVFEMGMQGLSVWPQWITELQELTGLSVGYKEGGSLIVAHPLDEPELRQFRQHLEAALARLGNSAGQCQPVGQAEIRELEPDLASQFQHGLYLQPEAHVHNRALLTALLAALNNLGVQLVAHTSVQCHAHQIVTEDSTMDYDLVIDTRGLGAASQVTGLRGVRGEVMIVETAEVKFSRPVRLLHPRYKLYVVPRQAHQFIIGATEIESEDYSPISLQSTLELSSALYSLNPAFAEARVLETQANCRPALADNLPRVTSENGLIRANGLFRHGYLLSPVVVNQVLTNVRGKVVDAA